MKHFSRVSNKYEAVDQLNRLNKVVTEKVKNNGNTVYVVDGKEYSLEALKTMANSVVSEGLSPR